MHDHCPVAARSSYGIAAGLLLTACLASGCASPLLGLANFKSDKALEIAAADDPFPNAAEVGLAAAP